MMRVYLISLNGCGSRARWAREEPTARTTSIRRRHDSQDPVSVASGPRDSRGWLLQLGGLAHAAACACCFPVGRGGLPTRPRAAAQPTAEAADEMAPPRPNPALP